MTITTRLWDVIGKHVLSTYRLKMELRCQRHADGDQLLVDLVEHYKPCVFPSLSQGLPV